MGKKYYVEEIGCYNNDEDELIILGGKIVGIGLLIFINYFFIKSLTEVDNEVIGILIGMGLSCLIGLIIFLIKRKKGTGMAIIDLYWPLLIITWILMLIGSIVFPEVLYFMFYKAINFEFWSFLKILLFNGLILAVSSPLVAIILSIIILIVGTIIGIPLYKLIYIIKSRKIKKTKCWTEIEKYCSKISFKETILEVILYETKIDFYDANHELVNSISFRSLGYTKLRPMLSLTIIDMLKKYTKCHLKQTINDEIEKGYYIIATNKYLDKELKKGIKKSNKRLKISYNQKFKLDKINARNKRKEYKKAVKEGKDW